MAPSTISNGQNVVISMTYTASAPGPPTTIQFSSWTEAAGFATCLRFTGGNVVSTSFTCDGGATDNNL